MRGTTYPLPRLGRFLSEHIGMSHHAVCMRCHMHHSTLKSLYAGLYSLEYLRLFEVFDERMSEEEFKELLYESYLRAKDDLTALRDSGR
jgi:hypothetical protein